MADRRRGRPLWLQNALMAWGTVLVAGLVLMAAAAPLLAPYDPAEQFDPVAGQHLPPGTKRLAVRLTDGRWLLATRVDRLPEGLRVERLERVEILAANRVANLTPEGVADRRFFLLGTDRFGRDVWSRLIYGARASLVVGCLAVALALTLGVAVGGLAAASGRALDALLMRLVDALLAFPWLFLLLAAAALFQPGAGVVILLLGATGWMGVSRLVRGEILTLKTQEYVLAARAMGRSSVAIFFRHLLPNALTPVLAAAALLVGNVILAESALSFLGMGIQPPVPSWGNMVAEGRDTLQIAWWVAAFPGAAIALAVIGFNLLGDGLRDHLDPRQASSNRCNSGATLPSAPPSTGWKGSEGSGG